MSDTHASEHDGNPAAEAEARDYGWAPKEEFKGPEGKWRPADDYLSWAKQTGRLRKGEFDELKRQFPAIRQENQQLKTELSEIKTTLNQFVEFSSKAEERNFNRIRQRLESEVEHAAANADPAKAREAMKELEQLRPEVQVPKPAPVQQQQAPQIDLEIQDWVSRETWYSPKNPALHGYATEVFGDLERNKPGMSKAEMLAETKRQTMERFPEKFGINPRREAPAAVASPGSAPSPRKRGKSYDDLPEEAKRACDKFVKQIPNYTREMYVKDYDWD